jgi:formylglycine-generating enzyme required for sulfatase activity/energy-coupling factor transporter ATP-binding protein EcfA2
MPASLARIVKVLVASPSDVDTEREIVEDVIKEWNIRNKEARQLELEAVLWESSTAPDSGDRTQGIINRQIVDTCDFAIGIFWTRIGTDTGVAPGGAVEEIERMMNMGKKVMLYFSDAPISREKVDKEQEAKLDAFKDAIQKRALVVKYEDCNRFRDKLVHQLDMQVCKWFLPETDQLHRYQEIVTEELGYIRMLGLPGVENVQVNLNDDTFVPLRLTDSHDSASHTIREVEHTLSPDGIMKRAFKKRRMLLVIGDPGAGKTTLLKYYALCALDTDHRARLGFSAPVNVFYLPLRELVHDEKGHYLSLPANLALWSERHHHSFQKELFDEWLCRGTALVLLDGLDEISNTEERKAVCRWIDNAWSGFSKAFFVVTSRFTGYRKDEGIELSVDCERADVQDFTKEQQERFLRNWFTAAFLREPSDEGVDKNEWQRVQQAKADERTNKMVEHLNEAKHEKGLRQLASVPMILQIMAIIWKNQDYMPDSRVKLYDAALDYLLEFRDRRRDIIPLLPAARARLVLAPLSLWMQETLKKDEAGRSDMQQQMSELLGQLNNAPSEEEFCDYLVKRAGLLLETGSGDYMFRHKSFREYLAGVELVKRALRTSGYLDILISGFGDDWWEEPIRFFIAKTDDAELFDLFMEKLFDSPKSDDLTQKEQLLLLTLIEEAPLKKVNALCKRLLEADPAKTTALRQRVILDCLKAVGKASALEPLLEFRVNKLAINNEVASRVEEVILALGGEVSVSEPEKSADGKPASFRNPNEQNAEYVLIPRGSYIYSATNKEVRVEDCYFAKYPVTNKLYRKFIEALPESPELREKLKTIAQKNTWDKGFADYLKENKDDLAALFRSTYYEDRKFGGNDQPVVGVSWYAAKAYCLWQSELEGTPGRYHLPDDVEWEWAAGGEEKRKYPWPNEKGEPSAKLLNYEGNVGATTPVGSYPEGATPEGLYDMAGNVWEWCSDSVGSDRVIRGGSWDDYAERCRSAFRLNYSPDFRLYLVGFRLVFVP